ncbi:MAG: hypothetical protein A2068_11895 [Ignavibacteria bacterium GWB2_35_6b]|nr:MAG: hypothetical protein A2068_11895 [Ignavibacteria bacterium GWB2_35_6b]
MKLFLKIFFISLFVLSNLCFAQINNIFSVNSFKKNLDVLGSDLFEGRGTGSTGGYLAANYLAQEFAKLNLKPAGYNGTYYQHIPFHASKALKSSSLILYSGNEQTRLELNEDYLLYKSGDQTFIPTPLELVFAGYGIIAPEFDYNDYLSIETQGKIVVMLEGEPASEDPLYFDGELPTVYTYPESKIRIAISRGAAGAIIIPYPLSNKFYNWNNYKRQFAFEDLTLAYSVTGNLGMLMKPETAEKLFYNSGKSLSEIFKLASENKISSFSLSTKISFKGEFKRRDFVAPNIIGMIEGSDAELKNEYVIVSAHYDHLGIGPAVNGDSVYNGVFDNAAGVSALLEIAAHISKMKTAPKRSIIFLLVTAEEKGLLGSIYYTDHPAVPLYKTTANINIDGIASFDRFKSIIGIGSRYSTLINILESSSAKQNLTVVPIPPIFKQTEAFNRSDQIAFANAGIPSVLVLEAPYFENLSEEEGYKKIIEYEENIYHSPFDDLSQTINYEAAAQHINFLYQFIIDVANTNENPEWNPGTPYINERLRSIAEKR